MVNPTEKWKDIIKKLKHQNSEFPHFIQHVNSDTLDNRATNLKWVTLSHALENLDLKVDWRMYLDHDEVRFVEEFAPMFRKYLFNNAS